MTIKPGMLDPEHEKEFTSFLNIDPLFGIVYLSGYLSDVLTMIQQNYPTDDVVNHLIDAREMISRIGKKWESERKYYRLNGPKE